MMRFSTIIKGLVASLVFGGVLCGTGYVGFTATETLFRHFSVGPEAKLASEPQRVLKPVIMPDTVVREEITYACGDTQVDAHPIPAQLIGKPFKELLKLYNPSDGWLVKDPMPQLVVASREDWDYCQVHRDYRHLAVVNGRLAIFQGPLGLERTLILQEDYQLGQLPKELQMYLQDGKIFTSLSEAKQKQLRAVLEFENDQALNVFLDGLDD